MNYYYERTKNSFRLITFTDSACLTLMETVETIQETEMEMEIVDNNKFMAIHISLDRYDNTLNNLLIKEFMSRFKKILKNRIGEK